MPIYKTKVRGEELPRLVRATTPAAARSHIVTAESVTAEEMADLLGEGVTIEVAATPATSQTREEAEAEA